MKSKASGTSGDEGQQRLAVLIDADNAQPSVIAGLLAEVAKYGVSSVKRIYGDFTSTQQSQWKKELLRHSISPVQQFAYTSGKNATDSSLIIDAMDLMYTGRFDGFCLVSSDSDFTRLAQRLREEGLTVYGFGERKTPDAFVKACDKFIYTEVLRAEAQVLDAVRLPTQVAAPAKQAASSRRGKSRAAAPAAANPPPAASAPIKAEAPRIVRLVAPAGPAPPGHRGGFRRQWLGLPRQRRQLPDQDPARFRSAPVRAQEAQRPVQAAPEKLRRRRARPARRLQQEGVRQVRRLTRPRGIRGD